MTAYAGLYSGVEQYASGRPAASVAVTVYQHGTTTPATLYADRTKGATVANPVTTDSSGNLVFYADPGLYDVTAASGGTVTVAVPIDPADLAAAATGSTQGLIRLAGDLSGTASSPTVPGLAAKLSTTYTGASTLSGPLVTVTFTDVPATNDTDLYQVYQTYSGFAYATRRDNERGNIRLQSRPGSYFDHLYIAICDPLNDGGSGGDAFRVEALDGSNNRYGVGGINRLGRLKTSLSTWTAVTSVDPNTTGRYAAATTSAGVGGAIDALGARWVADDRVELRGQLAATGTAVAGDVMCVLPAGYWPSKPRLLIAGASGGAGVGIEISTTGTVINRRAGAQSYNISLDGVCFSV